MADPPATRDVRAEVLALIRTIPRGRATTYGTLGAALGLGPRQVARVLASLSAAESKALPWHRVVAEPGRVSIPAGPARREQIARLKREGIDVDAKGKLRGFDDVLHVPQWKSAPATKRRARAASRRPG